MWRAVGMGSSSRSRRRPPAVALIVVLALGGGACSGKDEATRSGPRLSKAKLLAEGNAICAKLDKEVTAIIDQLVESAEEPTAKQSQKALRDVVPLYETAFDELRSLNPPKADEKTVDRFLALNDLAFEKLKEASKQPAQAQVFLNSDDDPFRSALEVADRFDLDACGTGGSRAEQELTAAQRSAATEVSVTTTEYAYAGLPPEVPAGPLLLGFTNKGTELHELVVTKLGDGQTIEQLLALVGESDPASDTLNVGFASAGPEGSTQLGVMTTPGTYALFCTMFGRDGVRHYAKGLATTLKVL